MKNSLVTSFICDQGLLGSLKISNFHKTWLVILNINLPAEHWPGWKPVGYEVKGCYDKANDVDHSDEEDNEVKVEE